MSLESTWTRTGADDMDLETSEDCLSNGVSVAPRDYPATSNDGMSDFSNSDISLPEVCVTTNFEENMSHEVQQAYRIFSCFLLDKHKAVAGLFLHAVGHQEAQCGVGGVCAPGQARLKQSMCLRSMEEKFVNQEYQSITEFVADFRLMLENCYRYHGVDHWLSKQAQKMEIMLEQKLTLLSRTLREKTTLAVTSKGRFGSEEERAQGGTSTRRRMSSRSLATITVGGHESVMVQTLRLEEQQRAKEEKRQRDLEKKEAEEISAKAIEEWEQTLLLQASPYTVDTLWELPAVGHFLCLAQTVLNLPEIVFFELERCLLMPRCSSLLSKIMSSLLSPWQRRATLHRRPALPYRRWEAELRLRIKSWYRSIGCARDQPARAEQLGLCHQFFYNLGKTSPLEEKPFHSLPFRQRVWLLKGLCDHVYETQKDVQDAVLAQPIHECRESILGYDSRDNAYIHFPHFCGADLRIYCQSPCTPPAFPFPSSLVRRLEEYAEDSDALKDKDGNPGSAMYVNTSGDLVKTLKYFTGENGDGKKHKESVRFWPAKKEDERCESESSDGHSSDESSQNCRTRSFVSRGCIKQETIELDYRSTTLEKGRSKGSVCTIKEETQDPCLNVGEHTYTGKKVESAKKIKAETSVEPSFKLVCTSLQELRDLISKTEDELDDLESTKKKLQDRWYLRKEAVKDLHSTLIRLLNELSPWEPKLLKAYHRNRLRLKKEFDEFKKHKEYSNFVREECVSSSSSSDNEDMSLLDHQQRSEDELEHVVPRHLLTGASTRDYDNESVGERSPSGPKSKCEMVQSNNDCNEGMPIDASSISKLHLVHPTTGQPKRYTAIPTLFAKSVGNKVTLMKLPVDYSAVDNPDRQSLRCSSSQPTTTVGNTKLQTQTYQSTSEQNSLHMEGECAIKQLEIDTVAATPIMTCLAKQCQTLLQNPLQVISNDPKGREQLFRKERSNLATTTEQPFLDRNRQEIIMQQVVNLPSIHVIHKSEEHQSKGTICLSTSVPGFTIPDHIQQVGPLKKTPTLSPSPRQQYSTQFTQPSQSSASHSVHQNPSSIVSTLAAALPPKPTDDKQELKTICIRDSQSILVTTRGGNTGIVKVQTSAAQNPLDNLPTSPIITISPQFKAFLVSKSAEASSVPFQKKPCPTTTVASVSVAQSHNQICPTLKSSAITKPTDPKCLTSKTSVDMVPGSNSSDDSTVSRIVYNPAQTLATHSLGIKSTADGIGQAGVISRTGLKRRSTDEQSKVAKCILVANSSSCASTLSVPKDESSTKQPLGSRLIVINKHSSKAPCALVGSGLNQATASGTEGQQLTMALSTQSLKMELSPGVDSKVLLKQTSSTLPPGLQIQVSGMTTATGHSIGTQSHCTFKKTSQSITDTVHSPVSTEQPASFTKSNTVTRNLGQVVTNASYTRSSKPSTFTIGSQLGSFTTNTTAGMSTCVLAGRSPAQVTSPVHVNPNPTSTATLVHYPSQLLAKETTPIISTSQKAPNKTEPYMSSATNTSTQSMGPTIGVNNAQQRIVISTSKPLAAGTQILLNNTCFIVPPQGLAPGSHVLIISSPSPQKVPNASGSCIGSAVPMQGVSQGPTTPQGQFLTGSQTRLPGVPGVISPFAGCIPVVPKNVQGPSQLSPKMNLVSASGLHVCSSALPVLSNPPQLAKRAAHVPSVITSGLGLDHSSTVRLATGTPLPAECSNTVSPVDVPALSRLPAPLSTLPSPISIPHSLSKVSATTRGSCIQPPLKSKITAPFVAHLGLGITTVSQQAASVIQVSADSLTSSVQNLPTSTVTQTESATDVKQRAYVLTLSPPSNTFQPITQLTTNPIHQPDALSNQTLVKPTLQKFHLGMANHVTNKLIISPSAILSSVQCQAKAAEPNVYPKQTALILTPKSSNGALHHQPTPSQPNN
ncbi:uncharacterized protein KIAA2026 isoform X2 [Corythoichthys intestinalis]|uniref:uncharacterized protein KIAA2026 isoform X2 n=1 Tax=Corythoichthys intestinalis TaxID=161448 RepID=UPI0025A50ACA|nr:uncharacterized protein KIAA2026 isoform X2 [Corythoichthys intestinalis]